MTTPDQHSAPDDVIDTISKALRRAWQLGQTYWQQADSEYASQNRKSDETRRKFEALVDNTRAALAAQPAVAPIADAASHVGASSQVTVDRGALQAAINMLRRDAEEGRHARGELADELLRSATAPEDQAGGPFKEYRRGLMEAFHMANMIGANRQGRTTEETVRHMVSSLAELANGPNTEPRASTAPAGAGKLNELRDALAGCIDLIQRNKKRIGYEPESPDDKTVLNARFLLIAARTAETETKA